MLWTTTCGAQDEIQTYFISKHLQSGLVPLSFSRRTFFLQSRVEFGDANFKNVIFSAKILHSELKSEVLQATEKTQRYH